MHIYADKVRASTSTLSLKFLLSVAREKLHEKKSKIMPAKAMDLYVCIIQIDKIL